MQKQDTQTEFRRETQQQKKKKKKCRSFSFPAKHTPPSLSSLHTETLLVLSAANNLSIGELFCLNFSVVNANRRWLSWNSSSSLASFSLCWGANYTLWYLHSEHLRHPQGKLWKVRGMENESNDWRWKIWFISEFVRSWSRGTCSSDFKTWRKVRDITFRTSCLSNIVEIIWVPQKLVHQQIQIQHENRKHKHQSGILVFIFRNMQVSVKVTWR